MTNVQDAIVFVQDKLNGKTRKGSGAPYECHLLGCLNSVVSYGAKDNTQYAAVLHDVVEDCGVTLPEIAAKFGEPVAKLVGNVTEDKSLSWKERKAWVVDQARHKCQAVGLLIMADKIDNTNAFSREWVVQGPGYWKKFNVGYPGQLQFLLDLQQAFHDNERVSGETEYPELKTKAALWEFDCAIRRLQEVAYDVWDAGPLV